MQGGQSRAWEKAAVAGGGVGCALACKPELGRLQQLHLIKRRDEFATDQKFLERRAVGKLLVIDDSFPEVGGNRAK